MKKIFNFSDFSSLYESEIYEQNLKIVVAELLGLYYDTTGYGAYTDVEIDSDLDSIIAGNSPENKIAAFKNIMSKVKQKALSTDKIEGADDLIDMIDSAYNKYLEALTYIVSKYKDSEEESKSMVTFINDEVEAYKTHLAEEENKNESNSNFSGYSQLFEGKKSLLSDAENAVNSLRGKIDSYKTDEDPRKKKLATDKDLEIVTISNSIKALKDKKNKDIEKSEISKILKDLIDLEESFVNGINKIIDESSADAELERLRNKARDVKDQITALRKVYLTNKSLAEDKQKSEKVKVKLDTDYIDYVPEESNVPNSEVKKFQELVIDTFKNIKSVADLAFYKKMGTSGKYGPNTRDMVKFLKNGFKLSDKSGDITKELVDEIQIQKDTIHESISTRVYNFSNFVSISEAAFDLSAGLEFAKTLPTYKSTGSSGSSSKTSSGTSKTYKKGDTGSTISAIQNILGVGATGASGTFDDETVTKVKEFQKLNNLKDDGVVGKNTLEAIYGTRDSAKTHKLLDKSRRGPWSYETIGKAIKQVYVKSAGTSGTAGTSGSTENDPKVTEKEIFDLLKSASGSIVNLFSDESFWKPYKNWANDEETKAAKAFESEWHKKMDFKYLNKVKELLATLPEGQGKSFLNDSYQEMENLKDKISKEITAKNSEDVYWTITDAEGNDTRYQIDADV